MARYDLGDSLGSGSFGAVVKATDRISNAPRAWKALPKGKDNDAMFRKEALTMSVLDHPHICRLFDVIEDSEQFYFVMELCEGGDLQHYLQACKTSCVPESSAAGLMRQMFCAIRYMHGRLMAHSDFAARNVLLFEGALDSPLGSFTAKLADFGSVRPFQAGAKAGPHKGDMWGLGLLMRGMVCDITRLLGTSPANKNKVDPNIWLGHSEEARCLCGRLLRRDPEARWTAEEALHHSWFYSVELPRAEIPADVLQRFQRFSSASVLVQSSLQAVAEQRQGNEALFAALDQNCDGYICHKDLYLCLSQLGQDVSEEDLQKLVQKVDPDDVGAIELSCFKAIMLQEKQAASKHCSQAAFRIIDRDMDGKITTTDLRKLFPKMTETEATRMIADIAASDLQGNGAIDLSQFRTMLQQYFTSESQIDWPKHPKPASKSDTSRKAKLQALEPHCFRTVDDDDDSHSSCAASSVSSISQTLSRFESASDPEDSEEEEEVQQAEKGGLQSGFSDRKLPGAPKVKLAKSGTLEEATVKGDVLRGRSKTESSWQKRPYINAVQRVVSL